MVVLIISFIVLLVLGCSIVSVIYSGRISYYTTRNTITSSIWEHDFTFSDLSTSGQTLLNFVVICTIVACLAVAAAILIIHFTEENNKQMGLLAKVLSIGGSAFACVGTLLFLIFDMISKTPSTYNSMAHVSSEDCKYMVFSLIYPLVCSFVLSGGAVFVAVDSFKREVFNRD